MILAPSDIHFLQDISTNGLLEPDEATMAELLNRFLQGQERIPKVQVAEKNGSWFALNNSYLHIIRDLEKKGKCARILVEVVPLTKVPKTLQKGMVVGSDSSSESKGARHRCDEEEGAESEESSSYTSSDYTDYDDNDDDDDLSDSEYDDDLSCSVCDRSFPSTRVLSQHQRRKRHFGCCVCSSNFPTLTALESHKESLDHWSDDDDGNTYESGDDDVSCIGGTDVKTAPSVAPSADEKRPEEMERLL